MSDTSLISSIFQEALHGRRVKIILLIVVVSGFLARLYSAASTAVINLDGTIYVAQAMAIYAGRWDLARACGTEYISLYHVLIPPAYAIVGQWEWAARSVSIFFGTAAILPLFFIAKRFCAFPWALLAAAAFAMSPFYVTKSGEVIKDPIAWFFSLAGLLLCINGFESEKRRYLFTLSCLSFCIGAFARIEVIVYMAGTLLFVSFAGKERAVRTAFFAAPLLLLVIAVALGAVFRVSSVDIWSTYLQPRLSQFFSSSADVFGGPPLWRQTAEFIMLSAKFIAKAVFLPFLIFVVWGLFGSWRTGTSKMPARYLLLLATLSLVALYAYSLEFPFYRARFASLMVLPLLAFSGAGFERSAALLHNRWGIAPARSYVVLGIVIVLSTLPFNLDTRRDSKLIYREIGEFISSMGDDVNTKVMGPDARIPFYAALKSNTIPCKMQNIVSQPFFLTDYDQLADYCRRQGVVYIVWDEKTWEKGSYDFPSAAAADFDAVRTWEKASGTLRLYKLREGVSRQGVP